MLSGTGMMVSVKNINFAFFVFCESTVSFMLIERSFLLKLYTMALEADLLKFQVTAGGTAPFSVIHFVVMKIGSQRISLVGRELSSLAALLTGMILPYLIFAKVAFYLFTHFPTTFILDKHFSQKLYFHRSMKFVLIIILLSVMTFIFLLHV
jgi:hypothetical protein